MHLPPNAELPTVVAAVLGEFNEIIEGMRDDHAIDSPTGQVRST